MIGDVNSYAIGEMPEINGMLDDVIIYFIGIDDERVFQLLIGRKLGGVNVLCPGDNANRMCAGSPAEAFKPKCR